MSYGDTNLCYWLFFSLFLFPLCPVWFSYFSRRPQQSLHPWLALDWHWLSHTLYYHDLDQCTTLRMKQWDGHTRRMWCHTAEEEEEEHCGIVYSQIVSAAVSSCLPVIVSPRISLPPEWQQNSINNKVMGFLSAEVSIFYSILPVPN